MQIVIIQHLIVLFLKIVHLIRAFDRGGAEKLLLYLLNSYDTSQEVSNVHLVILQKSRVNLLPNLNANQVTIFNVWSYSAIQEFINLYKWLKRQNPDILHAHLPIAGIFSVILGWLGIPAKKVYTEHSSVHRKKISFWLHGWLYSSHHQIIGVSQAVASSIHQRKLGLFYFNKEITVINNGIPINNNSNEILNRLLSKPLVIGTAAIFRPEKCLPEMVALFADIEAVLLEKVTFIIAGDGPELPTIKKAIQYFGLQDRVLLPGIIDDINAFLPQLDVFCMTSSREGFPVTLLEAMYAGCIPVVGNVGGIQEIDFEDNGLKFNALENDLLVDYLKRLITMDNETIQKMRINCQKIISDKYSISLQQQQLHNCYKKLLLNEPSLDSF